MIKTENLIQPKIINLDIEDEEIITRLIGRRMHE